MLGNRSNASLAVREHCGLSVCKRCCWTASWQCLQGASTDFLLVMAGMGRRGSHISQGCLAGIKQLELEGYHLPGLPLWLESSDWALLYLLLWAFGIVNSSAPSLRYEVSGNLGFHPVVPHRSVLLPTIFSDSIGFLYLGFQVSRINRMHPLHLSTLQASPSRDLTWSLLFFWANRFWWYKYQSLEAAMWPVLSWRLLQVQGQGDYLLSVYVSLELSSWPYTIVHITIPAVRHNRTLSNARSKCQEQPQPLLLILPSAFCPQPISIFLCPDCWPCRLADSTYSEAEIFLSPLLCLSIWYCTS